MLLLQIGISRDILTSRSGLAIYSEFMRVYGIKGLIDRLMPEPGSNRGYRAWQYIEPIVLMLIGGGRHIEELREIIQDEGLRKLIGLKEIPSPSTVGDWLRRQGNTEGLGKLTAEEVVREYNDRGQIENVIKELKNGFGMEDMPTGDFGANSFWFSLGVLAYNVFIMKKYFVLPEEFRTKTIQSIRWMLIEIAGKVIKHARGLCLKIYTEVEKFILYKKIRLRFLELAG